MTREAWARAFLREMGYPETRRNLLVLVVWMQSEGSPARWNPLATTLRKPGSTTMNSHGVQHYPDFPTGLDATADTLREDQQGYDRIRRRLKASRWPRLTVRAIDASPWGTGGDLMKRVLESARAGYYDDYASKPVPS